VASTLFARRWRCRRFVSSGKSLELRRILKLGKAPEARGARKTEGKLPRSRNGHAKVNCAEIVVVAEKAVVAADKPLGVVPVQVRLRLTSTVPGWTT
jgi:hypothetical protein